MSLYVSFSLVPDSTCAEKERRRGKKERRRGEIEMRGGEEEESRASQWKSLSFNDSHMSFIRDSRGDRFLKERI
jgi:hypothetical protein